VLALDRGSTLVQSADTTEGAEPPTRPMTKRRVARMDGDILIGALFPVHRQPSQKTAYTRQCGEVPYFTVPSLGIFQFWTRKRVLSVVVVVVLEVVVIRFSKN